ncbi:MAG: hypothetical protein D6772_02600 [Bacteroidetes bacterium]|nr:MAG: hypothetical protein D6772_02600 [Bacteroidota bacterium]
MKRQRVFAGWNTVEINELPSGVYSYILHDSGTRLGSGKMVKME